MNKVRKIGLNTAGRDFIVGDIHGEYSVVWNAMKEIAFNPLCDRLFCVGDLVDRGKEPLRALRFLEQPYVYSVMGNHESMFLEMYEDGIDIPDAALRWMTQNNGMKWWMDIDHNTRMKFIEAFKKLPVAMEVETTRGVVGIIHGEVPIGMNWIEFKRQVESGNKGVTQSALWGRERISRQDTSGVNGVGRIFCGHTPVNQLKRLGNVYFVDTGSVFKQLQNDDSAHLTMSMLISKTGILDLTTRDRPQHEFRVIHADESVNNAPFGIYSR